MAEAAQRRVQDAIKSFVNDLDKQHLRKLEKSMHECAVVCCSNQTGTIDEVHACVERCQEPTEKARSFVQSEMERFQESLSRCVLQCQDDIKDRVSANAKDDEIAKFRDQFENCAIQCCDKNVGKLPMLSKRIKEALSQGKF